MARTLWFERKFDFSFPVELYPEVIERLRGTPARIEERVKGVAPERLTRRDGDKWSIQENIGHLLDLDELFAARFEDFDRGAEKLRAADLTNQKTHLAGHNRRPLGDILGEFRHARLALVARLELAAPEYFRRTALHPRLNEAMRVTDLLYFVAEHDDHHLARISELLRDT
ncbi:MAG: DinB family protein [Candidatus Acidiferrales bacterium]